MIKTLVRGNAEIELDHRGLGVGRAQNQLTEHRDLHGPADETDE